MRTSISTDADEVYEEGTKKIVEKADNVIRATSVPEIMIGKEVTKRTPFQRTPMAEDPFVMNPSLVSSFGKR